MELPPLEWTEEDEHLFQQRRTPEPETIGEKAQRMFPDASPGEALILFAFVKKEGRS